MLHADETPVAMLDPGAGKTKRAYVWSYCTTVYDALQGVVDAGCLAHSRRKFFDLYANHQSQIAAAALPFYSHLYQIEKRAMDLTAAERQQLRQSESWPIAEALLAWMVAQRKLVHEGSAIAKAIDYSVNRWEALTRFLDDGDIPIDNKSMAAACLSVCLDHFMGQQPVAVLGEDRVIQVPSSRASPTNQRNSRL